jgi:hypothetical protein
LADAAAVKAAAKGKSKSGGASTSEEWAVFELQGASAGSVVRDVVIYDVAPDGQRTDDDDPWRDRT